MVDFSIRGMWIWTGDILEAGVDRVVERCREVGVEAIFPFVSTAVCNGEFYNLILPKLIKSAHNAGIEVHAWLDELRAGCLEDGESFLQVLDNGKPVTEDELCPANPIVRRHNVFEAARLVSRYGLDGITLEDRLYFSTRTRKDGFRVACYCSYCQKKAPIEKSNWEDWKRERNTQFMAEVSEAVHKARPEALVSFACVVPYDPNYYIAKGYTEKDCPGIERWKFWNAHNILCVDYAEWLRKGYIDFACPMVYRTEEGMGCFRIIVNEMADIMARAGRPVYIGLGFKWSGGVAGPETIRKQIQICREKGFPGIIIYSWNGVTEEHWKMLKEEMGK